MAQDQQSLEVAMEKQVEETSVTVEEAQTPRSPKQSSFIQRMQEKALEKAQAEKQGNASVSPNETGSPRSSNESATAVRLSFAERVQHRSNSVQQDSLAEPGSCMQRSQQLAQLQMSIEGMFVELEEENAELRKLLKMKNERVVELEELLEKQSEEIKKQEGVLEKTAGLLADVVGNGEEFNVVGSNEELNGNANEKEGAMEEVAMEKQLEELAASPLLQLEELAAKANQKIGGMVALKKGAQRDSSLGMMKRVMTRWQCDSVKAVVLDWRQSTEKARLEEVFEEQQAAQAEAAAESEQCQARREEEQSQRILELVGAEKETKQGSSLILMKRVMAQWQQDSLRIRVTEWRWGAVREQMAQHDQWLSQILNTASNVQAQRYASPLRRPPQETSSTLEGTSQSPRSPKQSSFIQKMQQKALEKGKQ